MIWNSFDEFLRMGGYGLYVWGSYGVTLVVIAVEIFMLVSRARRAREQLPGKES